MDEMIRKKLKEIEQKEKVKIILAVESGSRAWGFESADSDYDVRFIYVREKEAYLKLEAKRDVIEWQLDDTLDINGWDIQKALRLLYKSNPTLLEWCSSPIVYKETKQANELRSLLSKYFSNKKSLYHYLHMAQTNYRESFKSDKVKAKKYFYVLRPILAAKWIVNNHTYPPMQFETLVESELEEELKPIVYDLITKKKTLREFDFINKIDVLNEYIEKNLIELENIAQNTVDNKENTWEALEAFFLKLVL